MEIKKSEGQTLLTLFRLAVCGVAALCIFGMQGFVNATFDFFRNSGDMVNSFLQEEEVVEHNNYGNSYILYFEEQPEGSESILHIYKQYYITGEEGHLGMVDSSGNVIFEPLYEGIILLPHSCILKQNGYWQFYDLDQQLLTDDTWDEVEIEKNEQGKISNDLVKVSKDGYYGATDQQGNIIISPRWDDLELYTYEANWPIIRVKSDGYYGFVDNEGYTVINVRYDYAKLDTRTVPITGENGEVVSEAVEPAIFVVRNDDWGAIFQDEDGDPTSVDWSVDPPAEVLEDYQNNYAQ